MSEQEQITTSEENLAATTCPCCRKAFRLPKLLGCLHSLCEDCLRDRLHPDGSIICSVCSRTTHLPPGGFSALPCDWIVNLIQRRQFLESSLSALPVLCEECVASEDSYAMSVCLNCRAFLCACHTEAHRRTRSTRSHELIHRSECGERGAEEALRLADVSCSLHTLRSVVSFCKTCHRPVCNSCLALGHGTHEQVSVEAAAYQQRLELEELGQKFHDFLLPSIRATLSTMDEKLDYLDARAQELSQMISSLVQGQVEMLRNYERSLLSDVELLRASKARPLEEQRRVLKAALPDTGRSLSVATAALKLENDGEFLEIEACISENMRQTQKLVSPSLRVSDGEGDIFMEFVPNNDLLQSVKNGLGIVRGCIASASHSEILSHNIETSECGQTVCLNAMTRDDQGQVYAPIDGPVLSAEVSTSQGIKISEVNVFHRGNGLHNIQFVPSVIGQHTMAVQLLAQHIQGSPLAFNIPLLADTSIIQPAALLDKGRRLVSAGNHEDSFALGNACFYNGVHHWQVRVHGANFHTNQELPMAVGVIRTSSEVSPCSLDKCWVWRSDGQRHASSSVLSPSSINAWHDSEEFQLEMNCAQQELRITSLRTRRHDSMVGVQPPLCPIFFLQDSSHHFEIVAP